MSRQYKYAGYIGTVNMWLLSSLSLFVGNSFCNSEMGWLISNIMRYIMTENTLYNSVQYWHTGAQVVQKNCIVYSLLAFYSRV